MIRDNQTSIILITVIWLTAIALTGPNGNFPLNDDWSFGLTAKALFETGRFQPIGWAAMPQLTNAAWGALFLHLGEFSFTLLRFSTLTVSLIGLWAIYLTLKQLKSDSTTATIATLAIAFSPIYYSLSFTYMTDVPFMALIAISSLFYIKTLLRFSWKNYLLATTFILAAMLSRQLAIAVPLGFMAAFIVNREANLKNALISTLPFALSLISYFLFRNWLLSANLLPPLFDSSNMKLLKALAAPQESLKAFAANLYVALMYFGLFFSACLLNSIYKRARSAKFRLQFIFVATTLSTIGVIGKIAFNLPLLMPLSGNILNKTGLGPLTLHDTYIAPTASYPTFSNTVLVIITLLSLVGAVEIIICFIEKRRAIPSTTTSAHPNELNRPLVFATISTVAFLLPVLVTGFFDRYLLAALPSISIMLFIFNAFSIENRQHKVIAGLALGVVAFFSIAGTHDYLNWNRARWEGVDYLKNQIAAANNEIDGGFEFNGFCCYDPSFKRRPGKSWWWVSDDRYRIGFSVPNGYQEIRSIEFSRIMFAGKGVIFVSRRQHPKSFRKNIWAAD